MSNNNDNPYSSHPSDQQPGHPGNSQPKPATYPPPQTGPHRQPGHGQPPPSGSTYHHQHQPPSSTTPPARMASGQFMTLAGLAIVMPLLAAAGLGWWVTSAIADSADQPATSEGRGNDGIQETTGTVAQGETFALDNGLELTLGDSSIHDEFSGRNACFEVAVRNTGNERVYVGGYYEWRIENNLGQVYASTYSTEVDVIDVHQLEPGAEAEGYVCFDRASQGENSVYYEPTRGEERIEWTVDITESL